jgi:hypothetical protein
MKWLQLFILWLVFSPAYFFVSKKHGVTNITRWLLTIFSPFTITVIQILLFLWWLWAMLGESDYTIKYPSNEAPTQITGIEFPKLCPIDSSSFTFPAFTGVTKTYLPEEKPTKKFYKTLETKCKTDSFWTKGKDAYIYDNYYSNTTITVQLPHIGDTIKIKEVIDSGSY